MSPLLLALSLFSAPAAAQLRKITPVPPPSRKVEWVNCADAVLIGRYSGSLSCDDGKRRHAETLVYQQPGMPADLLYFHLILSASAADRMGVILTARLTDSKEAVVVEGELPAKDAGMDNIPVNGQLKRKPPLEKSAVYEVRLNVGGASPKTVQGNIDIEGAKAKVFIAALSGGGLKGVSCQGEMKKTQSFQLACGQ